MPFLAFVGQEHVCCVVKLLPYFMYNPVSNFYSRCKVTFF